MVKKVGIYKERRNKGRPWVVRWYGEFDPEAGKQRRYTKSFKRKVDAEEFAAAQAVDFSKGELRDKPEEMTLEEYTEFDRNDSLVLIARKKMK